MAVLVLTAAGCGGSGDDQAAKVPPTTTTTVPTTTTATTTTTTTTAPTTTTTTVPPEPTIEEAGAKYLQVVHPYNCVLTRIYTWETTKAPAGLSPAEWPLVQAELQPLYREASAELITLYEQVAQARWPAAIQGTVDTYVAEAAASATWFGSVADATTFDLFMQRWTAGEPPSRSSSVMRAKLGLESNVNIKTEQGCAV